MSLSYGDTRDALDNRKDFLGGLGIDYRRLVCCQQVHGSVVRYVREADAGKGALVYSESLPATDGLITDKKNLPLAVFTADCLSVFFYDSRIPAIGLIHAGWRSSRENICMKTVRLMRETFKSEPRDLTAAFSPAIRDCCYEVGEEFNDFFPYGVKSKNGRYYLDLIGINKRELLDSGVPEGNIRDSGDCTFCRSDEFFSFRKEGSSCGRMMSVAMLK
ncbi:MAG: peptidoglycan editing factor PgeF [Deltaproteobacteria bacterium]